MRLSLVLLPLMLFARAAWSDQVGLRPPESAVELRTYGFGLFPLDGSFSRLHGWMRYERANQGACEVTLQIEASSLTMENKTVRDRILGPDMMDVAQFPELAFHGICHGEAVIGDLTMHGETHPVSLSYTRARGTVVATGRLRRAEWYQGHAADRRIDHSHSRGAARPARPPAHLMRLPAALVPLRNGTFRHLWIASVIGWLGTWLQNTGAGWLMTSLAPEPLIVAMVQAATIMPVFLLALPGGALADIVDRRIFLLGTQTWTILVATLLAVLTVCHVMTAIWLLVLTFAIGIGSALTAPAWSAIVPELVPREDMVQAIALNGIGFNLTRAVGPAIAGFLILLGGSSLAFTMYAVSILAVIHALFGWSRSRRFTGLPREHFVSAMRAGMRFVRNTPAIQAAMIRTASYSIPASAPWALLPLYVRHDLGLGPGMYGFILGMMGVGGVTSGMLLPLVRARLSRGGTVVLCTSLSCAGMVVIASARHWLPASVGMLLFGLGWTSAFATIQAAAQLVCPPWVRARALAIYQLAQNGALTLGSIGWGVLGGEIGIAHTFLAAALFGLVLMVIAKAFSIEAIVARGAAPAAEQTALLPEAPARELVPLLRHSRGRIMETVYYCVQPAQRAEFLQLMSELHHVRGRAGALFWQLYEDVAHPEGWVEVWSMESWTDHLRQAIRLSEDDKRLLAAVAVFQDEAHRPSRYLAVDPHASLHTRRSAQGGQNTLPIAMPRPSLLN